MVEYVKNFTTSKLDSNGNQVVGSDHIISVFYYDSSNESWRRDYSALHNPFNDPNFESLTIPGSPSGWYETGTDASQAPIGRYFKISKIPFDYANEVLATYGTYLTSTPTSRGSVHGVTGDYFIDADAVTSPPKNTFPSGYNIFTFDTSDKWATTSGITNDAKIAWSLDTTRTVSGFFIDSYDAGGVTDTVATASVIGSYQIQVATTGTGLNDGDYTTIASGTNPYGNVHPLWVEVTPVSAKYIRLLFRNSGGTSRTGLVKLFVYTKEVIDSGMSLIVTRVADSNTVVNSSRTFEINQDIDLTGIDHIYFDIKDYFSTSGQPRVYINDVLQTDFRLANILDTSDMFSHRRGYSVNTSAFASNATFTIKKSMSSSSSTLNQSGFLSVTNFSVAPTWFSEAPSSKRGITAAFPAHTYIISDEAGLSIVDASDDTLWMRFDLGFKKMLQQRALRIWAKKGRIYLATTRGLFVIDLPANRCYRIDERGCWQRHGLDYRNVNSFDVEEVTIAASPQRMLHEYMYDATEPVLDERNIYDVVAGTDPTFGEYVLLGTSSGLILFNDKFDTSSLFYYSADTRPVHKVLVVNGSIWYLQGYGRDQTVNYLASISAAAVASFSPSKVFYKSLDFTDSLAGIINRQTWEVLNQDESMHISEGEFLTISGTHLRGGATGLFLKGNLPDASFTAKVKVRLHEFPPDARGAVRFGIVKDYHPAAALSLDSDRGDSARSGFFISAFNANPFGWPTLETAPLDGDYFGKDRGYVYSAEMPGDTGQGKSTKLGTPSAGGVLFENYALDGTGITTQNAEKINRVSTFPFLARDFTARADVQLIQGFAIAVSATLENNPAAFIGISRRDHLVPGAGGFSGTSFVDAAMMVSGRTTFSGVLVYTMGKYESDAEPGTVTLTHPLIPVTAPQSTGASTSPFNEWRVDYDHGSHVLRGFVNSSGTGSLSTSDYRSPHKIGLVFGTGTHGASAVDGYPDRIAVFKNVRVEYPALISGSRYKYGLESSDSDGYLHQAIKFFPSVSGIAASGDTLPASGTLPHMNGLSDGNLTTGIFSPSQFSSIGVALSGTGVVEALYLYDSSSSTSGWNSTGTKNLNIWRSNDNVLWTFYKTYELNTQERVSGLTKIRFCPAIEAKFIKANATSSTSNYAIPGGGAWAISEVRAVTVSGTEFFGSDLTESADFHEWELQYTKSTGEVKGYIDGVLIAKDKFTGSLADARLLLAHDLTVVSSGSHSDFHGDFKDLQITYTESPLLVAGEITGLAVTHATLSGGGNNYTITSASTSGVVITDIDFGASPLPTTTRSFSHQSDIFGESGVSPVVIADSVAHRNTGLIFVGTNTGTPSYYRKRIKRPYWFGTTDTSTVYEYGDSFSWCYLVGPDEVFIQQDRNSTYYLVANLQTGLCRQLSRAYYKDLLGLVSFGTSHLDADAVKFAYSYYDDRLWTIVPPQHITSIDVYSGKAVQPSYPGTTYTLATGDEVTNRGGRYFIAYSVHNHKIICGQNYIQVFDVPTNTGLFSPENRTSFNGRWGRGGDVVPWSPGGAGTSDDTGSSSAVYCDYDRSVYIMGCKIAGISYSTYFARYNIDKDYLETIGTGNDTSRNWPISDSSLYASVPFQILGEKVLNLAYDSRRARVYVLGKRSTKAILMYYDVVNSKWVDVGQDPPFTSQREWPSTATALEDTNHILYDTQNDRLLCSTGRGGTEGAYIYELHNETDTFSVNFDYVPARDGLPTASGISRHFTTSSGFLSYPYKNSAELDKDFYFVSSNNTNRYFDYTFNSGVITITADNPSAVTTNDVNEYYISAETIDPNRSFEISAKVALPSFTRNIFVTAGSARRAQANFIFGIRDGMFDPWSATTIYGQEDPGLYQAVEFRAGVSGTTNNSVTEFPLVGYLHYVDGFNVASTPGGSFDTRPQVSYDSYLQGGVDLGSQFSDFREFKLTYDYETDTASAFVDGVSAGTTTLRRKFGSNGIRAHLGFVSRSNNDSTYGHEWVVNIKDFKVSTKASDSIRKGRLITSVSGSIGSYYHDRWDSALVSGTSWIYNTNMYFPTSRKFPGFEYLATIGGIGDGNRLAELVAFSGPGAIKRVGLVGDLNNRHDSSTYLGYVDHYWDDIEIGNYTMVKDIADDKVRVYLNSDTAPVLEVPYDSLPNYKYQHVYYGKVNYGDFEKVYQSPVLSGTWTSSPNYTSGTDPSLGKLAFSSNAKFATIDQGTDASATYTLASNLGQVDLYVFYHATGFDAVKNAPYTVYAEGVSTLPDPTGEGRNIFSVRLDEDEFGVPASGKHTIRVDQRRVRTGHGTSTDKNLAQASGWVFIGRFLNPTKVVVTADASVGTTSTQGFVCADAIGVDIGKYGRSTFDMSVGRVRYRTGATEFPNIGIESSGLTVIDLSTDTAIDAYGEKTGPSLLDSNITSGGVIE